MNAKVTWILSAGIMMLFSTSPALADDGADQPFRGGRHAGLLEQYGDQGIDADGDGALTREEIKAFFDDNPDLRRPGRPHMRGKRPLRFRGGEGPVFRILKKLERLDAGQAPDSAVLTKRPRLDTDGDGQLSDEEWAAHVERAREKLLARLRDMTPEVDRDQDGTVSDEELQAFRAEKEAEARAHILVNHPETDLDGDGVLSDEEFAAFKVAKRQRMLDHHPELDTNGDGVLSDEEMQAFEPPFGGRHRGKARRHRFPPDL